MPRAADGVVTVSYRPLATMDELHILLLAAVASQVTDTASLEPVFSLPATVITKELNALDAYGLARRVEGSWMATDRGQHIAEVWEAFNRRTFLEIPSTTHSWRLGPGDFSIAEMIRDAAEINRIADGYNVSDADAAIKFLDDRRNAADTFAALVRNWQSARTDIKHGAFAEFLAFDCVRVAETDDALNRLGDLLAAAVDETARQQATKTSSATAAPFLNGDGKDRKSLQSSGQDVLKQYESMRRDQRKQNWDIAKKKAICEAWLLGKWLIESCDTLRDSFQSEPAAFMFSSTVPLPQPESLKPTTIPPLVAAQPLQSKQTAAPMQEEGVMRTIFRWLFG